MTDLQVNEIIARVMRKCYHEVPLDDNEPIGLKRKCGNCGEIVTPYLYISPENNWEEILKIQENPSPSTSWEDYMEFVQWFKNQDYFGRFIDWYIKENDLTELPLSHALMTFFDIMTCNCGNGHGAHVFAEFYEANKGLFKESNDANR